MKYRDPITAIARAFRVEIKMVQHSFFCRCGASMRPEDFHLSPTSVELRCAECSNKASLRTWDSDDVA
jgi:hypothetical protein